MSTTFEMLLFRKWNCSKEIERVENFEFSMKVKTCLYLLNKCYESEERIRIHKDPLLFMDPDLSRILKNHI